MYEMIGSFASTFVAVFVIVDPFAVIPVYLTITERFPKRQRVAVCQRATLIATALLLVFGLSGMWLFDLFGITLTAFKIAGGILLLNLGVAQLSAERQRVRPEEESESQEREDVSVFPLGTPLLAGPGAISTVVLLSSRAKSISDYLVMGGAIICTMAVSYWMLRGAHYLFALLGRTGLNLLTRIMGILLTAIAVQFVVNGIKEVVVSLQPGVF